MASPAYKHDEKVAPETSPTVCTWPVLPIYVIKRFATENFTVSTWAIQAEYMMKKDSPEKYPLSPHGLYSIYM
jgi:hypothetical protein